MKISLTAGVLRTALRATAESIDARKDLLRAAQIHAYDDSVTITSYDSRTLARVHVDTEDVIIEEPGSVNLDHSRLVKYLDAAAKGERRVKATALPVTIEPATDDKTSLLTIDGWTIPMTHIPVTSIPDMPTPGDHVATLDRVQFADAVREVAYAAAADDDQVATLAMVELTASDTRVTFRSTDRYRAAITSVDATTGMGHKALIRAKHMTKMLPHLIAEDITISAATQDDVDWQVVTCGAITIAYNLDAAGSRFPQIDQVVPRDDQTEATVNVKRADLVKAATKAERLTKAGNEVRARLTVSEDGVRIMPDIHGGREVNSPAVASAITKATTEAHEAVFNARLLLSVLTNLDVDDITLHLGAGVKPLVVVPSGVPLDDVTTHHHVLMTMKPHG